MSKSGVAEKHIRLVLHMHEDGEVTYGFRDRGGTTSGVCADVCNGN